MNARLDDTIDIAGNPSLFGHHRQTGLVGLSVDKNKEITLFRRSDGTLKRERGSFMPYLWLSEKDVLRGLCLEYKLEELKGNNVYKYLVRVASWSELKKLSDHISKVTGLNANHPKSPQLFLNDLPTQYLLATGQTYYNGMAYDEIHSLALRVYTAQDVLENPGDEPERIHAVALRIGKTGELTILDEKDESKLLWHLSGKIKKIDPDLICGHKLFKRDFELVRQRAKILKVKLDWGRSGERLTSRRSRMNVAEKQLDFPRYSVPGRELVDSWMLAILQDVSMREMPGYSLEESAQYFGLETGRRTDTLAQRAKKDTEAIVTLHRNLLYPYFLQSQIFPFTFENVIMRGNATRINHIFLRDYYRQGHSIPEKPELAPFAGGLTAIEHSGCAYGVYHCDVASLYPSLIISNQLHPQYDELRIFTGMLQTLRDFRYLAKSKQKEAENESELNFFRNLQNTFKILINSFYGYLGFAQGHFGDFSQAAEVTRLGRELLQDMIDWLKSKQAQILEVDTDGIYFVPSHYFAENNWIGELNRGLPKGIQVEFEGRYLGMYCHKMKNYALLEENGNLLLKGSGLRSRSLEPFLRRFIEDLIRLSLTEGPEARTKVFEDYQTKLNNEYFGVEELAKTETLIDSPTNYAKKIEKGARNRAAAYEIALGSEREYHAGESVSYYVLGNKASVTVYNHCKAVESSQSGRIRHQYQILSQKAQSYFQKI